jgi:hypothetical protein
MLPYPFRFLVFVATGVIIVIATEGGVGDKVSIDIILAAVLAGFYSVLSAPQDIRKALDGAAARKD